jgi:hypothetical protein
VLVLPHWRAHPDLHFRIGTVKRRYDYPTFRLLDIDFGGGNVATVQHDCCEAA